VAAGAVFLASLGGQVFCLSADTGQVRWQTELTAPICDSRPLVLEGGVYLITLDGRLFCLDLDTGERRWDRKVLDSYVFASPAAADREKLLLLAGMDGALLAVEAEEL